jgi:methyl-accepting chemotaxis protein
MKLTIRNKQLAAFGVVILLMMFSVGYASIRLQQAKNEQVQLKEARFPSSIDAAQVQTGVASASAALRGYVLFGNDPNDAARFKKERQEAWADIDSTLADMKKRAASLSPSERQQEEAIYAAIPEFRRMQDQVEELAIGHSSDDMGKAYETLKTQGVAKQRELDNLIDQFEHSQQTQATADISSLVSSNSMTQILLWLTTFIAAGCGISIAVIFSKKVATSLAALAERASNIAAGDLTGEPVEVNSSDEVGELTQAINDMQQKLQTMIAEVRHVAENFAHASEQIASAATEQARSADEEKDQTSQVATAIQEMYSTVMQVSENSNSAASAARQASETARKGGVIVESTLTKMRAIADSVSSTGHKIGELGKASDQIGHIAGVIDDIADQTNLLALNAAIEAARAGEQGRGFAVVADEVRKLAERTATATKEIAGMIKNIQDETGMAVSAMEDGTEQVNEGLSSTSKAGDSLKEIIDMAEKVGEMITQIATASTQQTTATEDMSRNVEHIAELVKTSASGAQESARACQELSGVALDLQEMVGNFKLNDSRTNDSRAVNTRVASRRQPEQEPRQSHSLPPLNQRAVTGRVQ